MRDAREARERAAVIAQEEAEKALENELEHGSASSSVARGGGARAMSEQMMQEMVAAGINPSRLSFSSSVSTAEEDVEMATAALSDLQRQKERDLESFQTAMDALFGRDDDGTTRSRSHSARHSAASPFLGSIGEGPGSSYFRAVFALTTIMSSAGVKTSPGQSVALFWCLLAEGCDPGMLIRTTGEFIPLDHLGKVKETDTRAGVFADLVPVAPLLAAIATAPFCSTVDERAFSVASLFYTPFRQLLSKKMGSSQIVLKMNAIFRRAEEDTEEGRVIAAIIAITSSRRSSPTS